MRNQNKLEKIQWLWMQKKIRISLNNYKLMNIGLDFRSKLSTLSLFFSEVQ